MWTNPPAYVTAMREGAGTAANALGPLYPSFPAHALAVPSVPFEGKGCNGPLAAHWTVSRYSS